MDLLWPLLPRNSQSIFSEYYSPYVLASACWQHHCHCHVVHRPDCLGDCNYCVYCRQCIWWQLSHCASSLSSWRWPSALPLQVSDPSVPDFLSPLAALAFYRWVEDTLTLGVRLMKSKKIPIYFGLIFHLSSIISISILPLWRAGLQLVHRCIL